MSRQCAIMLAGLLLAGGPVYADTRLLDDQTQSDIVDTADSTALDESRAAIGRVNAGKRIRLHTADGMEADGIYRGCTGDTLLLDVAPKQREYSIAAVKSMWVRGRSVKTGAIIGLAVGAVGGFVIGGLAAGLRHMDGGTTSSGGSDAAVVLSGIALGSVVLGALGAGVGATIPKWHLRYRAPDYDKDRHYEKKSEPAAKSEPTERIGGLRVLGGFSRSTWSSEPTGGVGGQANYFIQVSKKVLFGPEVGYYSLGESTYMWNFSGACLIIWGQESWRYFGIADLGYSNWDGIAKSNSFIGYGLGGGVLYRVANSPFAFYVEGRFQSDLGGWDTDGPAIFLTSAAGIQFSW